MKTLIRTENSCLMFISVLPSSLSSLIKTTVTFPLCLLALRLTFRVAFLNFVFNFSARKLLLLLISFHWLVPVAKIEKKKEKSPQALFKRNVYVIGMNGIAQMPKEFNAPQSQQTPAYSVSLVSCKRRKDHLSVP